MSGSRRSTAATSPARSSAQPRLRCAVYTRKSTEEGLDQDFNSLDAQREACAAFIVSQVGLGWKLVPDRYDDGGISGGTMDRPGLQRLLQDIRDRKVDVVVVYKIDRLTRSLADFAKIVEVFDASAASFVSVTQQFNTTTSMGRLTLNVLLSFAQFEREVTAERIRDKIAASRQKGMWMGGTVPFGYRVSHRKLVVEDAEAAEVKMLFERYLELGSVLALTRELNSRSGPVGAILSMIHNDTGQGRRRVAKRIGKGKLYYMLANPIYTGRVRHGDAIYAGEHDAIISDGVFEAVQAKLVEQAPRPRGTPVSQNRHLLTGLAFDHTGDRLSPIHSTKQGKRYSYYISSRLKTGRSDQKDGWRIPAQELETIVVQTLKALLSNHPLLSRWMQEARNAQCIEAGLAKAVEECRLLAEQTEPDRLRELIAKMLQRIDLAKDAVKLTVSRSTVVAWLVDTETLHPGARKRNESDRARATDGGLALDTVADDEIHDVYVIELPLLIKQRGVERRLVVEGPYASRYRPNQTLTDLVARAHVYFDALAAGRERQEVAKNFGVHPEDVSRLLPLAFLSPRIVEAILTGQQPADLTARTLSRNVELPIVWTAQHEMLGT
jgi:site-specific DNA recombinase